jgi:hypothetical protein
MSNTARLVFAVAGAAILAALATPELSGLLPQGVAQVLAVVIGAALHKLNDKAPVDPSAAQ